MPPSPPPGLNVIALISGGKDSLYSILHCIRNGHKVVALANLHPGPTSAPPGQEGTNTNSERDREEDIDSFMYQTIGHSVTPLYESALDIPLYRAPITGCAVDTSRVYRHDGDQSADMDPSARSGSAADETEDLVPLLRRVMQAHPEANAVSAGAILSTYQRTRIENVASRMGLVPLAWLWMYPFLPAPASRAADVLAVSEAGLLEDMAGCGCDARIIKVASGGLDEGFLWGNVSGAGDGGRALRRRIVRGMGRFVEGGDVGGAVLGEGGEYETLAVDGPGFLWKMRIEVEGREVRVAEGGVAYLRLRGAKCVPKPVDEREVRLEDVRRPELLDEVFAGALQEASASVASLPVGQPEIRDTSPAPVWSNSEPHHRQTSSTWAISNLVAPEAGPNAADQMNAIVTKVRTALNKSNHSTDDIVFATVLLNSMTDFTPMNNIYTSLFKKPNPPARVTVACGDALQANTKVMVSFMLDLGARSNRQGLHVQSRSYWAPANIGPYSQAMSVPLKEESRVVYIAGQIPLEPASMELASLGTGSWFDDFVLRTVLSLQHLWRVGQAMQVDWWLGGVAFVTGSSENIRRQVQVAWYLWKKMHTRVQDADDEDDDGPQLDVWDLKYGGKTEEVVSSSRATLPRFSALRDGVDCTVSPFLAVEVDELPRGSDIEWQGLGARCAQAELEISWGSVSATVDGIYRYICLEIEVSTSGSFDGALREVMDKHCQGKGLVQAVLYTTRPVSEGSWTGQVVPCRSVWGREGRQLAAGVVLQEEMGLDD